MRKRERGIALSQAQHELAREYSFASWPPPGLALVTWLAHVLKEAKHYPGRAKRGLPKEQPHR
jgi:hypothetical protein